eukprot:scaffold177305_cov51-Prasinocladus_malaysianus.AAC.2
MRSFRGGARVHPATAVAASTVMNEETLGVTGKDTYEIPTGIATYDEESHSATNKVRPVR